ncbi:MAG: alpha/beta hydrolase [Proteobacteria bacterium]|nr:alpha/beta hydrolase [Pseudomonadota bacterium]
MKKKIFTWMKRITLGVIVLMAFFAIGGTVFEYASRTNAVSKYSAPGEFAVVGDHRLHYLKRGPLEPISPTVVFESGLDQGGHLPWTRVQLQVSEFVTTVSYDRAGVLWSERGSNPKTGTAIAEELHELLDIINAPKPYILVGHSLAGLTLRSFASAYPSEVSGIVFVDVSHPDQQIVIPELKGSGLPPLWMFRILFSTGIARLMLDRVYPATEPDDPINEIVNAMFPGNWIGMAEENFAVQELFDEARNIDSFGDTPLAIIAGTDPERWDSAPDRIPKEKLSSAMLELQRSLLNLSTNSELTLANESGHYVQLQQPELVVEAIRRVISKSQI